MELPDPIQNFIHPTPGGEEGQSAALLAAGAARDGRQEAAVENRVDELKIFGVHVQRGYLVGGHARLGSTSWRRVAGFVWKRAASRGPRRSVEVGYAGAAA
eukprot:scaffold233065_cov36-Tisochrysis_lutea.AAC.1